MDRVLTLAALPLTATAQITMAENKKCTIAEFFKDFTAYLPCPRNLVQLLRLQKSGQRSGNLANFLQLSDSTGDSQLEAI